MLAILKKRVILPRHLNGNDSPWENDSLGISMVPYLGVHFPLQYHRIRVALPVKDEALELLLIQL